MRRQHAPFCEEASFTIMRKHALLWGGNVHHFMRRKHAALYEATCIIMRRQHASFYEEARCTIIWSNMHHYEDATCVILWGGNMHHYVTQHASLWGNMHNFLRRQQAPLYEAKCIIMSWQHAPFYEEATSTIIWDNMKFQGWSSVYSNVSYCCLFNVYFLLKCTGTYLLISRVAFIINISIMIKFVIVFICFRFWYISLNQHSQQRTELSGS